MSNEEWQQQVQEWNKTTAVVPALIREDIMKSKLDFTTPKAGFRTLFEDPLATQYSVGYKDKPYSLSYDVLRRVTRQLSVIGAIIATRCNQVAAFSVPYRHTKSLGFQIKHKDPGKLVSKGEREKIKELEDFIYGCGAPDPNPHDPYTRDDFETFLKKCVRDTLTYDQTAFEVVPDRRGVPYEFVAVDAATIRFAANDKMFGPGGEFTNRSPVISDRLLQQEKRAPFNTMSQLYGPDGRHKPAYVQVLNGQIENVYSHEELAFGIRNPRTDIYTYGYGYSEIEQLLTVVTAHLNAETYNSRFFQNGSAPQGILNFKGDNYTPDQLEGFKREWKANLEGVMNAWKTPILQAENGVDWIDMRKSNSDMEYNAWIEYLIKISCAVYLIDPAEINFDLHGGVSQTPLFESSNEYKLKASRDRGLRPLLRFLAKMINDHVISNIDDHFVFDFIGLDELSEQEKHELRKEQVSSYHTLNEVRRAEDLPDLPDGDVPMNPAYLQTVQTRMQEQMQQDQKEQQQEAGGGGELVGGGGVGEGDSSGGTTGERPAYSDRFTKAITEEKYLELDLDDWIGYIRGE